jgi:aspartyl-tRNA(Asn)/glutamyl-tRNA(Gln) amidotransferase subunit C
MILDDLAVTAALAHLDLKEEELAAALPSFERMLAYFSAMREADSDEAAFGGDLARFEPSSHVFFAGNTVRADAAAPSKLADTLLDGAAELESRYLIVPNVL